MNSLLIPHDVKLKAKTISPRINDLLEGSSRKQLMACAMAIICAIPGAAMAQQIYSIEQLPTVRQAGAIATSINNEGIITGYLSATTKGYAFIYHNGTMINLGINGQAAAANASGEVVGYANGSKGSRGAFDYKNGTPTYIAGSHSVAYGINNSGEIVGCDAPPPNRISTAFIYYNGTLTDLGVQGCAQAVNDSGQIAGYGGFKDGTDQAFIYQGGKLTKLGIPGGFNASSGYAISSNGQVTGEATAGDSFGTAFLYSDGIMSAIANFKGATSSVGWGVNAAGYVVGEATLNETTSHAFLYSNGEMQDLNLLVDQQSPLAPYVTLTSAVGINDNGWIVANGQNSSLEGTTQVYLLKPTN